MGSFAQRLEIISSLSASDHKDCRTQIDSGLRQARQPIICAA
jgi:hypothetical protein